jgi:hypothetical protein
MAIGIPTAGVTGGMKDTGPVHLMKGLTGSDRITTAGNFSRVIGKARMAAWNTTTAGIATTTAIFIMTTMIAAMIAATIAADSRFQNPDPGRQLEEPVF